MAIHQVPIDIPFPEAGALELRIAVGPCRIRVSPGGSGPWVAGRYEDPTGVLPLNVTQDGGVARLTQSATVRSAPAASRAPSLELALGTGRPFDLVIEGGANETVADLGGVPLTRLTVRHGAGRMDLRFSAPNPAELQAIDVASGGVAMDLRGLADANFAEMTLSGGAAQYRLEFGGTLRRDGAVRLNTGVAAIEIDLPGSTPGILRSEGMLGALDVGDGFVTREGAYWNEAAAGGRTPLLRMTVTAVLGSVKVRST